MARGRVAVFGSGRDGLLVLDLSSGAHRWVPVDGGCWPVEWSDDEFLVVEVRTRLMNTAAERSSQLVDWPARVTRRLYRSPETVTAVVEADGAGLMSTSGGWDRPIVLPLAYPFCVDLASMRVVEARMVEFEELLLPDRPPAWSAHADGSKLAVYAAHGGSLRVGVIDVRTGEQQLFAAPAPVYFVDWLGDAWYAAVYGRPYGVFRSLAAGFQELAVFDRAVSIRNVAASRSGEYVGFATRMPGSREGDLIVLDADDHVRLHRSSSDGWDRVAFRDNDLVAVAASASVLVVEEREYSVQDR